MWKKVPDPDNPHVLVNATPVEIVGGDTFASVTAELADGATVTVNVQITEISLIDGRQDKNGNPVYNVGASSQIRVNPAEVRRQ
ncbi:MAG: hypothetical protein OXI37_07885 [Gammaproteobacteria bacterium]|nr:hypothetical protein [Gammaproteobacteria bacterium]